MRRYPLVAVFAIASGCSLVIPWSRMYAGDGSYIKGHGMYQVRLGVIQVDRLGSQCFKLAHLGPRWEWVAGLRLEPTAGSAERFFKPETTTLKPEVVPRSDLRLSLVNASRQEVFSVAGPLDRWSWNGNHAFRDGRGEEYESAPHTYSFRRFEVGPDGGWGSRFTPAYSSTYTLCYQVTAMAPAPPGATVTLTVETYLGSL